MKRNSTIQELDESSSEESDSEDENEEVKEAEKEEEEEEGGDVFTSAPASKSSEQPQPGDISWQEQQELFLQQQLQRIRTPSVASVESNKLKDDEGDDKSVDLALDNLYESPSKKSLNKEDLEVMDEFMKEVEAE
jgi:hypothetical protein